MSHMTERDEEPWPSMLVSSTTPDDHDDRYRIIVVYIMLQILYRSLSRGE